MKIGVAIIACDRVQYTEKCIESILLNNRDINELILVNDGVLLTNKKGVEIINNTPPYQSVGTTKNYALKELLRRGCDQLFLVENDMIIKSPDIFKHYIEARQVTGITHLCYGFHGPNNRTNDYKTEISRITIEYPKNIKITLNQNAVGAFSYFDKFFIDKVGLLDTFYKNVWEHIDHYYRGVKEGLLPPFWWFPDIKNSSFYIEEIPGSIQNSSITHNKERPKNFNEGAAHYKYTHGVFPWEVPDTSLQDVLVLLKQINKYKI